MICLKKTEKNAKVELEGVAPVSGKLHPLEPGKFLSYLFVVFTFFAYFHLLEPGKFTFSFHLLLIFKISGAKSRLLPSLLCDKGLCGGDTVANTKVLQIKEKTKRWQS